MGFCHLLRVPCNVRCLPDQRALQPHLRVGFCRLLRTACDVHCFYSLINFNNMVHIYMYTRYFNITGTDGAVDFLVQTMFHILSAVRLNFWVEDNIRREECIVYV